MKKKFRLLSTVLSLSLLATTLSPATVNAATATSETVLASDIAGERTNIQYLEGVPGDTHLVYTYQQKQMLSFLMFISETTTVSKQLLLCAKFRILLF